MTIADVLANRRQWTVAQGDALEVLAGMPPESVQTACTSPPYYALRDYGVEGQIGLERTPQAYVARLVEVFREVRRVLRTDGTLWLNVGDSYNAYNGGAGPSSALSRTQSDQRPQLATGFGLQVKSLKPKDLLLIPFRLAIALQEDGWWVRSDIAWCKRAPMPESVTDRPTSAWEHIFLLTKAARYFYDAEAVKEPSASDHSSGNGFVREHRLSYAGRGQTDQWQVTETRNLRNFWLLSPEPCADAHFAVYPTEIPRRAILAGSRPGDVVLDPFSGSGTTGLVALRHDRRYVGIELNEEYVALSERRIVGDAPLFNALEVTSA